MAILETTFARIFSEMKSGVQLDSTTSGFRKIRFALFSICPSPSPEVNPTYQYRAQHCARAAFLLDMLAANRG